MTSHEMVTIRERILQIVIAKRGINSAELSAKLVTEFTGMSIREVMDSIDSVVKDNELIELEFEIPGDNYSVRFYLPKLTKIGIRK
jgi:hypothetical protein